jgi:hypothetical protein
MQEHICRAQVKAQGGNTCLASILKEGTMGDVEAAARKREGK